MREFSVFIYVKNFLKEMMVFVVFDNKIISKEKMCVEMNILRVVMKKKNRRGTMLLHKFEHIARHKIVFTKYYKLKFRYFFKSVVNSIYAMLFLSLLELCCSLCCKLTISYKYANITALPSLFWRIITRTVS